MTVAERLRERASKVGEPSGGFVRAAQYLAIGGVGFSLFHLLEHFARMAYWFLNPLDAPLVTPWAAVVRDIVAPNGNLGVGSEVMYLVFHVVLFAALVAMAFVAQSHFKPLDRYRHLQPALVVQGLVMAEQVLLTATTIATGRALGLTTLFGAAEGAWGSSLRVWLGFIGVFTAIYFASLTLAEMHEDNLVSPTARRVRSR